MNKIIVLFFSILLGSCAVAPSVTTLETTNSGIEVQRHLLKRYNDVRVNCGLESEPAFLCNGVMVRGTRFSTSYHSWDNSLASHQSGGVSFSYLRHDSNYDKLAYGYTNGYIFLPVFFAGGKLQPEILCVFPIDASTLNRSDKGCGAYPGIAGSGPCQSQGIYSAAAWWSHYNSNPNRHLHQCGFDVRDVLNAGATTAFDAAIKAMALMGAESFHEQNEMRLQVWQDGSGASLPLEAFFYVNDSAQGRQDARSDQMDFKNTTGLAIPVISIWLPRTQAEQASFKYVESDQAIPLP